MRRKLIRFALPLAIGAAVYASVSQAPAAQEGYTCPLTGEELRCKNCCPLNDNK